MPAPALGRFALVGAGVAVVALARPGNVVLVVFVLFPLVVRGAWRNRLRWAGAFAAAAVLPLLAWTVHNGLRYDEWGLARGGKAVIPLYRALLFDRIVEPDNGPASRRLAAAVEEHLVTREPYRSYGITTRQVFEEASARVHEDLYTLSDEVFGWDEDYATLRDAGVEAVKEHPGAYASAVLDTIWQQLSEPYYRVVGDPHAEPAPADEATGLPPPSEGQLIPGGQNLWILRPDNAIRQEWTSPTSFRFVFDRPADRPRFDELVRRRDELLAALPDRSGNATLALWLNRLSRWYPRPILWVALGVIALALRRTVRAAVLVALATGALLVVVLNALGLGPRPALRAPGRTRVRPLRPGRAARPPPRGRAGVRRRAARGLGLAALAVAVLGLAVAVPSALDEHDATAEANSALDWADREVAWGNGWTLSQEALYTARSLIPRNGAYQVSVGPTDRFESPLTGPFVSDYLHSFLMPRRQVDRAGWIVCSACDAPPGARVVWDGGEIPVRVLRRAEAQP